MRGRKGGGGSAAFRAERLWLSVPVSKINGARLSLAPLVGDAGSESQRLSARNAAEPPRLHVDPSHLRLFS